MRGFMDFEITGEETQEQLEELMAKMGEIEVEGDDEETEEGTEPSGDEPSETVQTETGDKQAPTPGAGTEEEGKPQEDARGILARDGKHVIPYDVPWVSAGLSAEPDIWSIRMINKGKMCHAGSGGNNTFYRVQQPVY